MKRISNQFIIPSRMAKRRNTVACVLPYNVVIQNSKRIMSLFEGQRLRPHVIDDFTPQKKDNISRLKLWLLLCQEKKFTWIISLFSISYCHTNFLAVVLWQRHQTSMQSSILFLNELVKSLQSTVVPAIWSADVEVRERKKDYFILLDPHATLTSSWTTWNRSAIFSSLVTSLSYFLLPHQI